VTRSFSLVYQGRINRTNEWPHPISFTHTPIYSYYCFTNYHSSVAAFVAQSPSSARASTELAADRRAFLATAAAAAFAATPLTANAIRDYENVGLLGGGEVVDINNANVRVYLKMPGMYPTLAGKVASNGPYNSVADVFNIPGLTGKEKEILKKYESRFTAQKPQADYVIDIINNGLYVHLSCYLWCLSLSLFVLESFCSQQHVSLPFFSFANNTVTVKLLTRMAQIL